MQLRLSIKKRGVVNVKGADVHLSRNAQSNREQGFAAIVSHIRKIGAENIGL